MKGKVRWLMVSAVVTLGVGLMGSGALWGDEAGPPAAGASSDGQTVVAQAAPAETTTTQPAAPAPTTTTPGTGNVPTTEVTVTAQKEKPATGTVAEGYRVDNVSGVGPWPEMKLQDTPYSINVMSKELLDNLQVQEINDVWKYNPYTDLYIPSNRLGDNIYLRGSYNYLRTQDGLPVYSAFQPLEDKERVEVMTGVVGFVYGIGAPAGNINFVTKRAPDRPLADLTMGCSGMSDCYAHADVGGPLNPNIGYRLNVVGEDGETYVKEQYVHKYLLSGALDFHITDNLKLETDASRYFNNQTGMQVSFDPHYPGNGSMRSISPNLIDPYKLYGQPWSYERDQYTQAGGILTWKINDTFTWRSALREQLYEAERLNVNSNMNWPLKTYSESIYYIGESDDVFTAAYSYLDASFNIGPVSNKITTGLSWYDQDVKAYPVGSYSADIPGVFNVEDPAYVSNPTPFINSGRERPIYTQQFTNLVIGDDIKFTDKWSALVGVNHAAIDAVSYDLTYGAKSEYDKQATTPAVAFMYKPIPIVTTYVSYLEALEQGGVAPDFYLGQPVKNAGQTMPPAVDRQYEAGVKATLDKTLLTLAWFNIEQANQYVNPFTLTYVQSGRTQYRGVEFTATGSPFEHFRIFGGATYLNAQVIKNAADPQSVGTAPPDVASNMLKLVPEYDVTAVPGLTLTGAILYRGRYYYGATWYTMPSVTTFDLGARYTTSVWNRPVIFRLNADNLFDRRYFVGDQPGDPLTFHLSMTIKFL